MGWPEWGAFGFGEDGGDFRRGAAVEGPGAMDFREEGVEGEFPVAFEAAEDDAKVGARMWQVHTTLRFRARDPMFDGLKQPSSGG